MDIRTVLEPLTSLKIFLHDQIGQKEDIISYIKSVVRSDRSMRRSLQFSSTRQRPLYLTQVWCPENIGGTVMSVCSSLIAIVDRGNNQVVQLSHFSVKEYLTSERLARAERLSYYHTLPELHTILAHAGLSVLLEHDDKAERDTIGHFPLTPYSARHWVDHARFRDVSSHVNVTDGFEGDTSLHASARSGYCNIAEQIS
jgi:hypothetical protein